MRIAALVAAGIVAGLSACGGGGGDAPATPTTPSSPPPVTPPSPEPPAATLSFDKPNVTASASRADDQPQAQLRMTVRNMPAEGVWVGRQFTKNGVESVDLSNDGATATFTVRFKRAGAVGPGTYADTLFLRVCYDEGCTRIVGTITPISITYTVTLPSLGAAPPYESRAALPHDVIDSEFSQALNAIVMVSANPRSALYVYDVATGTERELVLNKVPRSVSIAPDGLTAAVGHDALITHVLLSSVGQASPTVKLLNVSADILDVVLANGFVYALPRVDQWVQMHSVNIATNTDTAGNGLLRAGALGRAVPSGQYLYAADNGLSPSDFTKWDLRSGVALPLGDSPYHGDYPICGDIWPSEDGTRLYTPCGATFRSTTDPTTDMRYAGSFDLQAIAGGASRRALSISQSAEKKELMVVDAAGYYAGNCGSTAAYDPDCASRLRFYDSDFLQLTADYTLPPLTIGAQTYPQKGLQVFHDGSGDGRYLISRALGITDPASGYYVTRLAR